jgi:HEAT repeat protein
VADALGKMGPVAGSAVPELIVAGHHPEADLRRIAIRSLGAMGPEARGAVPFLTEVLADNTPGLRREAVIALGKIGPAAKDAVPSLINLVTKGQTFSPFSQMLPGLEGVRRAAEFEESLAAVEALAEIGPAAREAVPSISRLLRHPVAWVRVQAAEALARIGREPSPSEKRRGPYSGCFRSRWRDVEPGGKSPGQDRPARQEQRLRIGSAAGRQRPAA